jgi:AsmA-like C-terminal region/Domain of Unknown Function (DUF748)
MRKTLLVVGGIVGALILVVVVLFVYAALNLNSLIKANRGYILARATDSIGRPVEVQDIRVSLGWGVMMDLTGVKIGDDPSFSQVPFIQASDVYGKVEFVPLLMRKLIVTRLVFKDPVVRILRDRRGELNISTFGKKSAPGQITPGARQAPPGKPAAKAPVETSPMVAAPPSSRQAGALASLSIKSFAIENGEVIYEDAGTGERPTTIKRVDLDVADFSLNSPFDFRLKLAALGDSQNLGVSGKVGPLARAGALNYAAAPVALTAVVGPVTVEQIRALPGLSRALPARLSIAGPLRLKAAATGTLDALKFSTSGDFGSNRIAYSGVFEKPAGTPLRFTAEGAREGGKVKVGGADLTLADLQLKASKINLAGGGNWSARVDTNRFDLGALAGMLAALSKYKALGRAEIHADIQAARDKPEVAGVLSLSGVALTPPGREGLRLANLSGDIRMSGQSGKVGPLTFNLGSSRARFEADVQSLEPARAAYNFSVDSIKLAEFVPSREGNEQLNQVSAKGTLAGALAAPNVSADLSSASGMVANVPYRDLALSAELAGKRMTIRSLKLNTYGGAIAASGQATMASNPQFNVALNLDNIDLHQALAAQKAKAADIVRGLLTGQIQVSGAGSEFEQVKPTLKGNGRMSIRDGKLVGVNVVASALQKVDNIPGIGSLVPQSVVANHPELFRSPDTDIKTANLTFTIQGPRLTSHDITVRSADYSILGDGWFDMDKNIDVLAHILLSRPFSDELRAQKKNVVYLTNKQGEVDIPLQITGALPKPRVLPDVGELAQRAGKHLAEEKGKQILGGFLEKKGLGGLLGGGKGASATPAPSPTATPSSPFAPLKGFFR